MPLSEMYSGSATISTTEWSLTTNTSGPDVDTGDAIIQVFVDVANVANGDAFRLRVYEQARSGDTQRVVFEAVIANAQAQPLLATPALLVLHGWDATLVRIAGSDRTLNWSIRAVS